MASEKIELRISAKEDATDKLQNVQKGVKDAQKGIGDFAQSGGKALSEIAGQIEGPVSGAVRSFGAVLGMIASGGVFGLIAGAASSAFDLIATEVKKAAEATRFYGVILANELTASIGAVSERFKGLTGSISAADAEAKSLLALVNGEVSHKAEVAVHKLHVETLQKMTDEMSASAKGVILADEALQAVKIRHQAVLDQAVNSRQTAESLAALAVERRTAAESALADAAAKRAEAEGGEWFAQRARMQSELQIAEDAYKSGMIDAKTFIAKRNVWVSQIKSFEEEYANEIRAHASVIAAEKQLSEEVEKAKAAEVQATRAVELAKMKEATASNGLERATLDAEAKLREAHAAAHRGIAADEEKIKAELIRAQVDAQIADITRICMKNQVQAAEYIKAYSDALFNGMTHAEAYGELQKKLNEAIAERTKSEKDAASGVDASGNGKTGGTKSRPIHVSISSGSIAKEIGEAGGSTWSETQKAARKQHNEMLKDALPLYRAMKGQMPKDQQKLFEQYMMSKYTPDQVKKIWDEAQSKQLIDKAERKKQTRYLNAMVEAMKKQGLG
jgi:hypothetical protein